MRLYAGAAVLQTVSGAVGDAIKTQAPWLAEKVRVIGNPVDVGTFKPATYRARPSVAPLVLYAGRVHREKGLDLLVAAFRTVAQRLPAARLHIVGPAAAAQGGGGESYREQLAAAAVGLNVRFVEAIGDPHALADAYRQADCFCYPSIAEKGEAFGLAVLEAMACGVPCVISDLACFRDFACDGETALLFDHRSANADAQLADAIVSVLRDPDRAAAIGRAGQARARQFDAERIADAYLGLFREIHGA
jgi:glycosyltransferase involved in cell wall biosynthesis